MIETEIERNYVAFKAMLRSLLSTDSGRYALLRDQQLLDTFASPGEAARAGYARFPDRLYSIQFISDDPIDLGFYSYGDTNG